MFLDQGFNADRENLVDGKINVRRIGQGQCELHIMLSCYHPIISILHFVASPVGQGVQFQLGCTRWHLRSLLLENA